MGYIAVNTTAEFVKLDINASGTFANANVAMADTANVLTIPALQDITVNATPGTFEWQQLNELSSLIVTTPSTNSLSVNMVLDDTAFFTGAGTGTAGIFDITNEKTLCYFRMYWQGSSAGDRYIEGEGYLSSLAPTVSASAPVWVAPVEVLVVGSFTTGLVPA
jgi:hypothetical protein